MESLDDVMFGAEEKMSGVDDGILKAEPYAAFVLLASDQLASILHNIGNREGQIQPFEQSHPLDLLPQYVRSLLCHC